jgi:hypothetical protein
MDPPDLARARELRATIEQEVEALARSSGTCDPDVSRLTAALDELTSLVVSTVSADARASPEERRELREIALRVMAEVSISAIRMIQGC